MYRKCFEFDGKQSAYVRIVCGFKELVKPGNEVFVVEPVAEMRYTTMFSADAEYSLHEFGKEKV